MRKTVCIAGKNEIAVNALRYLAQNYKEINIVVVLNKTDGGYDSWQPSLKKAAIDLDIQILTLDEVYNIDKMIFISLEFDRIVKTEKFKTSNLYNIHFSKLPQYKGMYTSVMPIINGEEVSGVTLHRIDNGIDTGAIIAQKEFAIDINDTARDVYFKYLINAFELFKENIDSILNGSESFKPQSSIKSTYYSKNSIDFKNINIDFNKTSYEIHNQIRAFIFAEYQLPSINGCKVAKSILTDTIIERNFFEDSGDMFVVSGIDGYKILLLKENIATR